MISQSNIDFSNCSFVNQSSTSWNVSKIASDTKNNATDNPTQQHLVIDNPSNSESNFVLNPITNKQKEGKRIKKNVLVLKENTSETLFVNYTIEDKRNKTPTAIQFKDNTMTNDFSPTSRSFGDLSIGKNRKPKVNRFAALQATSATSNIFPINENLTNYQYYNNIDNSTINNINIPPYSPTNFYPTPQGSINSGSNTKNSTDDLLGQLPGANVHSSGKNNDISSSQDDSDATKDFSRFMSRSIRNRASATGRLVLSTPSTPLGGTFPKHIRNAPNSYRNSLEYSMAGVLSSPSSTVNSTNSSIDNKNSTTLANVLTSQYTTTSNSNRNSIYRLSRGMNGLKSPTVTSSCNFSNDSTIINVAHNEHHYLDGMNLSSTNTNDTNDDSSMMAQRNSVGSLNNTSFIGKEMYDNDNSIYSTNSYSQSLLDILDVDFIYSSPMGMNNGTPLTTKFNTQNPTTLSQTTLHESAIIPSLDPNQQSLSDQGRADSNLMFQNLVVKTENNSKQLAEITPTTATTTDSINTIITSSTDITDYSNPEYDDMNALFLVPGECPQDKPEQFDEIFGILK